MIRKAVKSDVDYIMPLFRAASMELKRQGVDQWQNGYPDQTIAMQDIEKGECYLVVSEKDDMHIMASAVISFAGEPTYAEISDGQWMTCNQPYAVIHRIVSSPDAKRCGGASALLEYAIKLCREHRVESIRIDTHCDNKIMQQWLAKNGFVYCGEIRLSDGAPRIAFEKML